ncbi:MAG: hypothetical protein ACPHID_07550 [Thermoplasmatota archaeon]
MLDTLTHQLFDHAGMFPPAALSFEDAVTEAAELPEALKRPDLLQNDLVLTPEEWRKISDESLAAAGFDRPLHVCLVGVDLDQAADVLREAQEWNTDGATASPPRVVTAIEAHFSPGMALGTAVGRITALRYLSRGSIDLYIEPKWDDATWNKRMDDLMAMYDGLNADVELHPVGLKFRAWGPTALRPETVAKLLPLVDERALPLKATQGLHHPLCEGFEQNTMGFLGLVAALRFCDGGHLNDEERLALLTESDASAFEFGDIITWRGHELDVPAVDTARVPFSIGSCSLREPDADLARLFD